MYKILTNLTLISFGIYLILGNVSRIGHNENFVVSELVLYLLIIIIYMFKPYRLSRYLILFFFLIITSYIYGLLLFGFNETSFFYLIRLIMMFFSGVIIGNKLFEKFGDSVNGVCLYFVNIYFIIVIIGFLILLLFPNSVDFWVFLSKLGVNYWGDPHINRLISTIFDPNFLSIILIFPLICSWYRLNKRFTMFNLLTTIFFLISILFTGSRSGLGTLILMVVINSVILFFFKRGKMYINTKYIVLGMVLLITCVALYPIYGSYLERILNRIMSIGIDDSADHRFDSIRLGLELFNKYLFLGTGYRNLTQILGSMSYGLSSLDSSILNILINFGLILSIVFLFMFLYFMCYLIKIKNVDHKKLIINFISYLLSCTLFASNFNDLLFYQFWVIPIIAYSTYLSLNIKKPSFNASENNNIN